MLEELKLQGFCVGGVIPDGCLRFEVLLKNMIFVIYHARPVGMPYQNLFKDSTLSFFVSRRVSLLDDFGCCDGARDSLLKMSRMFSLFDRVTNSHLHVRCDDTCKKIWLLILYS